MYLLHNIPIKIGKQRKGHKQRPYVQIHQENVSSIYSLHLSMHAKVNKLNIFCIKKLLDINTYFLTDKRTQIFYKTKQIGFVIQKHPVHILTSKWSAMPLARLVLYMSHRLRLKCMSELIIWNVRLHFPLPSKHTINILIDFEAFLQIHSSAFSSYHSLFTSWESLHETLL